MNIHSNILVIFFTTGQLNFRSSMSVIIERFTKGGFEWEYCEKTSKVQRKHWRCGEFVSFIVFFLVCPIKNLHLFEHSLHILYCRNIASACKNLSIINTPVEAYEARNDEKKFTYNNTKALGNVILVDFLNDNN